MNIRVTSYKGANDLRLFVQELCRERLYFDYVGTTVTVFTDFREYEVQTIGMGGNYRLIGKSNIYFPYKDVVHASHTDHLWNEFVTMYQKDESEYESRKQHLIDRFKSSGYAPTDDTYFKAHVYGRSEKGFDTALETRKFEEYSEALEFVKFFVQDFEVEELDELHYWIEMICEPYRLLTVERLMYHRKADGTVEIKNLGRK